MIKKLYKDFRQFFKYCLVGVSGTLIDLAALYALVEYAKFPVIPATVISFLLAVTNNFIWNKVWTFKSKSKNIRKLYIKFFIVSVFGLGLTVSSMYLLVNLAGIWYMFAKAITSGIVLIWNFLANKFWTFKLNLLAKIYDSPELDLSIIIPAYNEENRIKQTLLAIHDYLENKGYQSEIIVVDDGSTDKTTELVEKYAEKIPNLRLVSYEKNQGKGNAVKIGIEEAKGELILFTDADNSTPIEELSNLQKALSENNADIAIGSRYLPDSNVKIRQSKARVLLGRSGNLLIQLFLIDGIKDTQCGFKLFKYQAAKEIFSRQKVKHFGFDMEALAIASRLNYKIIEVPVSWFNSAESRVRPIKDGLRTLKDLAYIKLNLWSGRYEKE